MKSTTLLKLMLGAAYTLPLMTSYSTPASAGVSSNPGMEFNVAKKCLVKKGSPGQFDGIAGTLTYPSGDTDRLLVCPGGVVLHPDGPDGGIKTK